MSESREAHTTNPSLGLFGRLPYELRLQIYSFALDTPSTEVCTRSICRPPLLCFTSRQVFNETIELTLKIVAAPCPHHRYILHLPRTWPYRRQCSHGFHLDIFSRREYRGTLLKWHEWNLDARGNDVRFILHPSAVESVNDISSVVIKFRWPGKSTWGEIEGGTPGSRLRLKRRLGPLLQAVVPGPPSTGTWLRGSVRCLMDVAADLIVHLPDRGPFLVGVGMDSSEDEEGEGDGAGESEDESDTSSSHNDQSDSGYANGAWSEAEN